MLTFSQITSKIDRSCGTTSTTYSLANKAVDVNLALMEVFAIALKTAGWNVDDFNQTHDPFISANLVASQRDYHFAYDEQSNLILGINRVMVADAGGLFRTIYPINQQLETDVEAFINGQNTTGTPTRYDKTGNGIFLDPIPSYSYTQGLKVFIDREPTYFLSTDTTKIAGIDGLCHDYLYLKPSYEYARDKGLQNADRLFRDMQVALERVKERYGNKDKDTVSRFSPNVENCR